MYYIILIIRYTFLIGLIFYGAIKSKFILALAIIFIIANRNDFKDFLLILFKIIRMWNYDRKHPSILDELSDSDEGKELFEWKLNQPVFNPTDLVYDYCSNCSECKERDGKIKSYVDWYRIGVPMSSILPCGYDCSCGMHPVKSSKGVPKINLVE